MNVHARAVVFLASTARVPLVTPCVELLTKEPRVERTEIRGLAVTLVEPQRESLGTIVFLNGGTRLGCVHPAVQRLARGIGRAGYRAVVPELPRLREGRLTPATLDAVVAIASEVAITSGAVALFGVSAGASLALLAAADPSLSDRVSSVVAIAPWAELEAIVELATTGQYRGRPRETTALVREFVAASVAAIPPGEVENAFARLSPIRIVDRLDVPIELASAADDGYFPLAEVQALAAAAPRARLTITSLLDHVRLRPALRDVPDLARFCRFTARSLSNAATTTHGGASTMKSKAAQPAKFLAVGTAGYVVNLLAFAVLYGAGSAYFAASATAYLGANALMYLGNRYYTFRLGHAGFWSAYARYLAVGLLVAAGVVGLLSALVEVGGVDARVGQAIALLLISPFAFVVFKRWTFQIPTSHG
jgi:putative flippase GtrA/acetyl esterase/lipase